MVGGRLGGNYMIPFYPQGTHDGYRKSDDDPTFFVCRAGHPWKEIKAPDRDIAIELYMEALWLELMSIYDDEWFFVRHKESPMVEKVRAYPVIKTLSHEMWFKDEWDAKYANEYGEVPK